MIKKYLRVSIFIVLSVLLSQIYAQETSFFNNSNNDIENTEQSNDTNLDAGETYLEPIGKHSSNFIVGANAGSAAPSDDNNILLNEILTPTETNHKLTPNPNEFVDLFSGTLKLVYTDFSAPVGPGLNMEINRNYSSDHYYTDNYNYDPNYIQSINHQAWTFQREFIRVPKNCPVINNTCLPIYVNSKGQNLTLLRDNKNLNEYRTINNWHGKRINNGYVLTSPNGLKYSFTYGYSMVGAYRYHLEKIENRHGQYVAYHYAGTRDLLSRITSSNPGQVIDIKYYQHTSRLEVWDNKKKDFKKIPHYSYTPQIVYFNGKIVAQYNYEQHFNHEQNWYTLSHVTVNDKSWSYNYGLYRMDDRRLAHHVNWEFLNVVTDNNGKTVYNYSQDPTLRLTPYVHAMRVNTIDTYSREGVANGSWAITHSLGGLVEGFKTKVVTVKNNNFATINTYFNYHNENVWRVGALISNMIFKSNDTNPGNILQQTSYHYVPALHNNDPFKLVIFYTEERDNKHHVSNKADTRTYRQILKSATISRDGDTYTTSYSNHDEYDNPQDIQQTGSQGTRTIKQTFQNITDKNILGLRTSLTVNNKLIQSQEYDSNGNLTKSSGFNTANNYLYDSSGYLASVTDILSNSTNYSNYYLGTPQLTTHADGTTESQVINPYGYVTAKTNPKGFSSEITYNDFGQVLSEKPAIGLSSFYTYPSSLAKTMNRGNYQEHTVNTSYDLPYKQEMGSSKLITFNYDSLGRKIFESNVSSADGHIYSYDSLNRLVSDCYSNEPNTCTRHEYLNNNTHKITAPNGEYKIISSVAYGSPDSSKIINIKEDNRETTITRDDLGFVTAVKQGNVTKQYFYDKDYNLIKYIEPETGVTEYSYDAAGKMVQKKQGTNIISYKHDNKNYNLLNVKYSDTSPEEHYTYDKNGNVTQASKGRITWNYQYDELDRLVAESMQLKSALATPFSVNYNYNPAGHLESMTYPDKTTIDFNPDEYGRATQVGGYIENIKYHPNNYWQSMDLLHQRLRTSLDSFNRVNKYTYGTINLDYVYDTNNNLTGLQMADSTMLDYNYQYGFAYDKSGRLINTNLGASIIDYKYDQNDNMTQIRTASNADGIKAINSSLNFEYADMRLNGLQSLDQNNKLIKNHRLNQVFSYDVLGNIKSDANNKYSYGLDGNMQAISGLQNGEFEYDHNQNRIYQNTKTLKSNNETVNFYNKAGIMLYEQNLATNQTTKYLHLGNNKVVKVVKDGKSGASNHTYLYNDALGSPVAEVDAVGKILWREAYLPFGARLINDTNLNKYWFVGKEQDASGLSYFGARYYNPVTARFMAPDPAAVNPEEPFSFNRYAYGNNNPYKYVDPDGRAPADPFTMQVEVVLGGIAGGIGGYLETQTLRGIVIGATFGAGAALISSPLASRAAGAGAAAKYNLLQRSAFKAADISVNAMGSISSSYINTGNLDVSSGARGAIFGAAAHGWFGRHLPKEETLSALGTYNYSKFGTVVSVIPDLKSYHDKNNSFKVESGLVNKSQNTSLYNFNSRYTYTNSFMDW